MEFTAVLTGTSLGGWQVKERLGAGCQTEVYRAVQAGGSREVALKVLVPQLGADRAFLERLRADCARLRPLDHPNLVPLIDVGVSGQRAFVVAPLVPDRTLATSMRSGRADPELAWRVLEDVARALHVGHQAGVAHRALKPGHVLIHSDGRGAVTDFGLCSNSIVALAISSPSSRMAAPEFLAPEQVKGLEPDWRADVYAMGVLVFELLTGRPPFQADTLRNLLIATLSAPVPSAHDLDPSLPAELDWVLARALAKDPAHRQGSVLELIDQLGDLPAARPPAHSQAPSNAPATAAPPLVRTEPVTPAARMADGGTSNGHAAAAAVEPVELVEHHRGSAGSTASIWTPGRQGRQAAESAVTVLERMGIIRLKPRQTTVLNSYFSTVFDNAKEVAGARWWDVLEAGGLTSYTAQPPPDDGGRTIPLEHFSQLNAGMEEVFGGDAALKIRQWGRLTTDRWLRISQRKPIHLMGKQERRVATALYAFSSSMDRVRGEHLHAWKQVDDNQFWIVHYRNLFASGRRKPDKSCHFWTASFEATIRWGGLANRWVVDEVECGCQTGTFDCVFVVQSAR